MTRAQSKLYYNTFKYVNKAFLLKDDLFIKRIKSNDFLENMDEID